MTQRPPIAMSAQWKTVMRRHRGRCWCKGACGSRHTATRGRCDRTNAHKGSPPLLAAPEDLSLVLRIAPVPKETLLLAWCHGCYGKALARAKRDARAEPEPTEALFDLP